MYLIFARTTIYILEVTKMTHLENAIGIIIASITVVFIYCGLALIEILDRIANMF